MHELGESSKPRRKASAIISSPKIHSQKRALHSASEEEIRHGMDRKSKARMLSSAKSKALRLQESQTAEKNSLLIPLNLGDQEIPSLKEEPTLFNPSLTVQENEFGAFEMLPLKNAVHHEPLSPKGKKRRDKEKTAEEETDLLCREESLIESPTSPPQSKKMRREDIHQCKGCGCYGFISEFLNSTWCSKDCESRESKKDKGLFEASVRDRSRLRRDVKHGETPASSSSSNSLVSDSSDTRESSRANTPPAFDKKRIPPHLDYPWFHPKTREFSWKLYLDCTSSKGAPSKFFKQCISSPLSKGQWFNPGMKLEAVDPEHPSLICVASIAEVQGYRLRLHFDGFPDSYDFWECGNSPNIFPVGWCNKKRLTPPEGHGKKFDWKKYLMETKSSPAPEKFFLHKSAVQKSQSSMDLSDWKIGSKLEAVDRQNTSMVCVATVAEILAGWILIHFDGWEKDYDYWITPESPYVHYKGWCDEHAMELNPPNDFPEDEEFDWEVYLRETKSSTVPKSAFKCRQETSVFKKHMKLEVVDKRNPRLIRVATVVKVNGRQIKVHYDGWPDEYDFWYEDDSLDIFPPEWTHKINGNSLENPLTSDEVKFYGSQGKCPTPGCRSVGHIKGPIFMEHSSLSACPYSPQNMDMDETYLPDRFKIKETIRPENDLKPNEKITESKKSLKHEEIRQSVFNPPSLLTEVPRFGASFLLEKTRGLSDVRNWSSHEVASFVTSLPGLEKSRGIADIILDEEIDGISFSLLQQADLVKILGLKLGPALKIFHSIQILKSDGPFKSEATNSELI
eukprot:TRINITY_DN3194_c0_g1_i1.p1 TRINITY_DN3194_c0_g1~~TRINITY_DN3194_c0_g1_i1.p1  ORF type:complete len:793 (-),score=204.32 TRINITY_DN3194_c0_g1_i1:748-3126(-)